MERQPDDINPEVARLYSSNGDVVPVRNNRARIVLFAQGDVPPCVEVVNRGENWEEIDCLFIDDVQILNLLAERGVEATQYEVPLVNHIDAFTDPSNDSSDAYWAVNLIDEPFDDTKTLIKNDKDVGTALDYETEVPMIESPVIKLDVNGQEICLDYGNSHVYCISSDPGMSHIDVKFVDNSGQTYNASLFLGDIGKELLEEMVKQDYPVTYLPHPDRGIMDKYRIRARNTMEQNPEKLFEDLES